MSVSKQFTVSAERLSLEAGTTQVLALLCSSQAIATLHCIAAELILFQLTIVAMRSSSESLYWFTTSIDVVLIPHRLHMQAILLMACDSNPAVPV